MPLPRTPNPFAMRMQQRRFPDHKQQQPHLETTQEKPFYNPSRSNVQATPQKSPAPPTTRTPMIPQPQQKPPVQPQPQPQNQPMPVPPEAAAAEFRRVNKALPDGVRYEPLDDETMRLLQDNGHIPKNPITTSSQPAPVDKLPEKLENTSVIFPESLCNILENLSQDERNAHIFYTHFAESSEHEPIKKALATLAKDSEQRQNQYISLISTHFNHNHTPKEIKINTNIPIADAITLALTEENKSLVTLGNLLDQVVNTDLEQIIQRIINKKIIAHQILMTIQTTTTPIARSLLNPPEAPEANL
ncbi:MAG: hypothetical protein FWE05_11495 [Defluviitaleaceae bacterium]|nr:hypothetical protein [Defluviitaleaceae bacterium]